LACDKAVPLCIGGAVMYGGFIGPDYRGQLIASVQLEPFAEADNRGRAHSRLYQSEPVISKIMTLICGSPPARAPVEPSGSLEDRTRSAAQPGTT
jgi:hypothetical protein